jgi:hypothetical protein
MSLPAESLFIVGGFTRGQAGLHYLAVDRGLLIERVLSDAIDWEGHIRLGDSQFEAEISESAHHRDHLRHLGRR